MLDNLLADPRVAHKRIVHCCSQKSQKRANAACLICAYQVLVLGRSAKEAFEPFRHLSKPFLPFRDAARGECAFQLTIEDCLLGLQKSVECHWFDWRKFDVFSYEYFGMVEEGDMNWIIPGKFMAFPEPCSQHVDADGYPALTPEDYSDLFVQAGISLVVRLNKKSYDEGRFINQGIKHVDLEFRDGSVPPQEIVSKFLYIAEKETGAMAVHCKAGLGRTGTLIGLYAMKHSSSQREHSLHGIGSADQGASLAHNSSSCVQWSLTCSRPTCLLAFPSPTLQMIIRPQMDVGQADSLCSTKRITRGDAMQPLHSQRMNMGNSTMSKCRD